MMVQIRFVQWQLTPAEADVALFALKGCDVAEIAALRATAAGTVRAQLARIYAKAGVTSHTALLALFVEELIDTSLLRAARREGENDA
ncbi:LuxR C-terminal-related transcriptional regulator [Caenibius tardaugens]|uniref:LuxR C-terminal-related transcriptional regulator n=1 Tax=Caenibius tardaugens TaxID=169176 RepID=UPI001B35573B|nr:LuxR C-terminal-related transcriptional regulator [Caenibius tardaugens]